MPARTALLRIGSIVLMLGAGPRVMHAGVVPAGDPFVVKMGSVNNEHNPKVGFARSGRGVIVWTDSHDGLRMRSISAKGELAAQDRLLVANTKLPEIPGEGLVTERKDPFLAMDSDGGFWLFWTEERDNLKVDIFDEIRIILDRDVWGQHFDLAGKPTSQALRLNTTLDGYQSRPRAARVPCDGAAAEDCGEGNLMVAWESDSRVQDSVPKPSDGIFGRLLGADGRLRSAELRLSPVSFAIQTSLCTDDRGNVAVAWVAPDSTGRSLSYARFFSAGARALGPAFAISPVTGGQHFHPFLAPDRGGKVLAFFDRTMPLTGRSRIIARQIESPGKPTGDAFSVSNGLADFLPVAAATPRGAVVLWLRWGPSRSIQATAVEGANVKNPGDSFALTFYPRFSMGLGARPDGRLLAVWEGYGNGSSQALLGRWLAPAP